LTSAQEIRIMKTAPGWRNWQTRTVEGRVGQPMRVQIPPRAPDKPETALQKGFWPAGQGVATDSATNSPAGRGPHKRTRLLKEQIAVVALFLLQDRGHFHRVCTFTRSSMWQPVPKLPFAFPLTPKAPASLISFSSHLF